MNPGMFDERHVDFVATVVHADSNGYNGPRVFSYDQWVK